MLGASADTVEAALVAAGWRSTRRGFLWSAAGGHLRLRDEGPTTSWRRYVSSSLRPGNIGNIGNTGESWPLFVRESLSPAGPFKLLPGRDPATVRLAADVPFGSRRRPGGGSPTVALPPSFLEDDTAIDRLRVETTQRNDIDGWASDLGNALTTLLASGGQRLAAADAGGAALSPVELAASLERNGWNCVEKGQQLYVNFQDSLGFHQARLRATSEGGLCLDVELAETTGWGRSSVDAAAAIAAQANRRLRLARIVWRTDGERETVLAQVHLGRLVTPSHWLDLGLEALDDATTLLGRELPALADHQLAEWILSTPFHNSQGDVS